MRLKNFLIVVNNIEKSRQFYHDLFGLQMILDNGADRLYLSTEPENDIGMHIYHKYGFRETGEIDEDDGEAEMMRFLNYEI